MSANVKRFVEINYIYLALHFYCSKRGFMSEPLQGHVARRLVLKFLICAVVYERSMLQMNGVFIADTCERILHLFHHYHKFLSVDIRENLVKWWSFLLCIIIIKQHASKSTWSLCLNMCVKYYTKQLCDCRYKLIKNLSKKLVFIHEYKNKQLDSITPSGSWMTSCALTADCF